MKSNKKKIFGGVFSSVGAVYITRKVINYIGIDNIELETKILLLVLGIIYFIVYALLQKDKLARKYYLVGGIGLGIVQALLAVLITVQEINPSLNKIIKTPLVTILSIVAIVSVISLYGGYVIKNDR
jgi:hypothetical protein